MDKKLSATIILLLIVGANCSRPAPLAAVNSSAQGDASVRRGGNEDGAAPLTAADAEKGFAQVRFDSGSSAYDIPFETNANKIYLPVRINGGGPFWLILDSGAAFDVIDRRRAEALGLALSEAGEVSGAGERSVSMAVASDVKMSLAGVEFGAARVNVIPVGDSIERFEGRAVDGLLGQDFFQRFVVEIDYAAGRISLHDPRAYAYAGRGEAIPLEMDGGHAYVSATLTAPGGGRHAARFLVDTGFRLGLVLAAPFVEERGLRRAFPKALPATPVVGVGGESPGDVARAAGLQLGRYQLASPVVTLSRARSGVLSGGGFAGILGADVLRRFKVVFDYSRRRMFVEPAANYSEPFGFDQSGLLLRTDARGFGVYRMMEGSPAAEAGLRESDVIDAVDGRPASSYSLEQLRQMFMGPEGSVHELSVGRDGVSTKTTLKLRRMI